MFSFLTSLSLKSRRVTGLVGVITLAIVALVLYGCCRGAIREHFNISFTSKQFLYGLVSVEVCLAVYFYGVGWISPHWRPDPKPPAMPQAAQHALGPAAKTMPAASGAAQGANAGAAQTAGAGRVGEVSR
jgi:hypothetical protein